VGPGLALSGNRLQLWRILSDPDATVSVVVHRDRLARFGGDLGAALSGPGRRIVVADRGAGTDERVGVMIVVLRSMCGRVCGGCGARNRVMRAITASTRAPGAAP
jgi:putative resolvase